MGSTSNYQTASSRWRYAKSNSGDPNVGAWKEDWAIAHDMNVIRKTLAIPCAQKPLLIIETKFKVLGSMLLAALSVDPRSILRGYLRPKDRRMLGRYKAKDEPRMGEGEDGEEHKFWKDGIPDTGMEIGKKLPGADLFAGRDIGAGERFLWEFDRADAIVGFGWFVLEIGGDGLSKWQSAVCNMKCVSKPPQPGDLSFNYTGMINDTWLAGATTAPTSPGIGGFRYGDIWFLWPADGVCVFSYDGSSDAYPLAENPISSSVRATGHVGGINGVTVASDCQSEVYGNGGSFSVVLYMGFSKGEFVSLSADGGQTCTWGQDYNLPLNLKGSYTISIIGTKSSS